MGCLVDAFIICLKNEWYNVARCPRKQDIFKLVTAVLKKYRIMFRKLIQIVTEEQWEKNIPGDQAFLQKAVRMMDETGEIDRCLTIDGRKYSRGQNGELVVT